MDGLNDPQDNVVLKDFLGATYTDLPEIPAARKRSQMVSYIAQGVLKLPKGTGIKSTVRISEAEQISEKFFEIYKKTADNKTSPNEEQLFDDKEFWLGLKAEDEKAETIADLRQQLESSKARENHALRSAVDAHRAAADAHQAAADAHRQAADTFENLADS